MWKTSCSLSGAEPQRCPDWQGEQDEPGGDGAGRVQVGPLPSRGALGLGSCCSFGLGPLRAQLDLLQPKAAPEGASLARHINEWCWGVIG